MDYQNMINGLMSKRLRPLSHIIRASPLKGKAIQIEYLLGSGYTGFGICRKYTYGKFSGLHFDLLTSPSFADLQSVTAVVADDRDTVNPNAVCEWCMKTSIDHPSPWSTYICEKSVFTFLGVCDMVSKASEQSSYSRD